jgi:antitoxin HicB
MLKIGYPATFTPDEDGRPIVRFPDLPEAMTDGKDLPEASAEAQDCLGSALASRLAHKEDIPHPGRQRTGQKSVPVPLWIAPKVALYWAMREAGVNNSQLARRLGVRETVIRRMLDPNHATKAEKIQAALEALGKQCLVVVQNAA